MQIDNYKWSILERRRIAIFPVALLMYAYTSRMKLLVGTEHKHFIMSYAGGFLTSLKDEEDWVVVANKVYAYVKKHPNYLKEITATLRKKISGLISHSKQMGEFGGDIASDAAAALFNKYCDLYIDTSVYGECIPYTIKELLGHELHSELSKFGDSAEIFSSITVPQYISFMMREEIDFLRRLRTYKAQKDDGHEIASKHCADYGWLTYDYDNGGWSVEAIKSKFEENAAMDDEEVGHKLGKLNSFTKQAKLAEEECIKKYKVSEYVIMLAEILKDSMILMDIKKEELTKVHYYTYGFFLKAADYLGIERKFLSYVVPYEFFDIIRGKKADLLIERYNSSSLYISKNGWNFLKCQQLCSILDGRIGSGKIVKGMCAYPGRVKGRARVVRTIDDIRSFRSGEILIATMTTIDFIEAMKKASAIVTDDGGVICHAAIISREMKKPCIVGSKIATNMFSDGDFVAVDAGKGIVSLKERSGYDL